MDIARRFAKEGFVALAVDLISRAGGTASVVIAILLLEPSLNRKGAKGRKDRKGL